MQFLKLIFLKVIEVLPAVKCESDNGGTGVTLCCMFVFIHACEEHMHFLLLLQ